MKQMRCVICKRPLLRAAKTVPTKGEPLHFGRQCAIKAACWCLCHVAPGWLCTKPARLTRDK